MLTAHSIQHTHMHVHDTRAPPKRWEQKTAPSCTSLFREYFDFGFLLARICFCSRIYSRESKYEIRVLRVVACVRKFLYTVTQKMRVYKLKLAKLTKKMAKIRPGTANGRYGRTASAQKKDVQNRCFSMRFYVKKLIFDKKLYKSWFFNVVLGEKKNLCPVFCFY